MKESTSAYATFHLAWVLLKDRVQKKTSWGKNELLLLMADTLQESFDRIEKLRSEEEPKS